LPVEVGLEMYAEKPVVLPFFTGYVARGMLLHVVREIDPAASGLLHELNVSKPYSVTPLRFRRMDRSEKGNTLDPQFPCRVGFRFLKDEYSTLVLNFFQKQSSLMVFDTVFRIASLTVSCKSYEDLWKEARAAGGLRFWFNSPTYFASLGCGYHWMFPDVLKVFLNLLRCWNLFSDGKRFGKEEYLAYKGWLDKNVGVSRYELWTWLALMRKKKATGFKGWVTYEMKDREGEWNRTTCMLAKFAEFANLGGNRTGGFGVTRVVFERE
jgi:CRISPR-associated endoribonuclease Cas6